jgi:hypothetical protein
MVKYFYCSKCKRQAAMVIMDAAQLLLDEGYMTYLTSSKDTVKKILLSQPLKFKLLPHERFEVWRDCANSPIPEDDFEIIDLTPELLVNCVAPNIRENFDAAYLFSFLHHEIVEQIRDWRYATLDQIPYRRFDMVN